MKRVVVTSMIEHICRRGLSSLPPLLWLHKQLIVFLFFFFFGASVRRQMQWQLFFFFVCFFFFPCELLVSHGALMLPVALSVVCVRVCVCVCVCVRELLLPFLLFITVFLIFSTWHLQSPLLLLSSPLLSSPSSSSSSSSSPLLSPVIQHFRADVIAQTKQAFRALSK